MQETFGAGAAGLVDHDERSRRELVLVADAGHQPRHLIGAAAGTRRNHKLDRLGGLPGDCHRLPEQEMSDDNRGDPHTLAITDLHETSFETRLILQTSPFGSESRFAFTIAGPNPAVLASAHKS